MHKVLAVFDVLRPKRLLKSLRPVMISTPARTLSISGLKSRVLKLPFRLKNDGEKWSRIFYFEIHRTPSEIAARLIQPFWADFFALGSSNSEGAR